MYERSELQLRVRVVFFIAEQLKGAHKRTLQLFIYALTLKFFSRGSGSKIIVRLPESTIFELTLNRVPLGNNTCSSFPKRLPSDLKSLETGTLLVLSIIKLQ